MKGLNLNCQSFFFSVILNKSSLHRIFSICIKLSSLLSDIHKVEKMCVFSIFFNIMIKTCQTNKSILLLYIFTYHFFFCSLNQESIYLGTSIGFILPICSNKIILEPFSRNNCLERVINKTNSIIKQRCFNLLDINV